MGVSSIRGTRVCRLLTFWGFDDTHPASFPKMITSFSRALAGTAQQGIVLNRTGHRANFRKKGGRHMFETPETKGEQSGMGKWVGILVVVAVVIGGILLYMGKKNAAPTAVTTAASAAAPTQTSAAAKDLRVVSRKMDKDNVGAAIWSVELRNLSQVYSYSNIQYETSYVGADSVMLATNHGTIPSLTLDPGESQSAQFREALPSGTALFNFKITGATASK
jgi:hypothetical protein